MKILNLYPGIGGNRARWGDDHEITAVEYSLTIATAYSELWPGDTVIIGDAHEYLLEHYKEFDFIWASPPCQSHSRMRYHLGVGAKGYKMKYPDFRLYEEIVFLMAKAQCPWVIENVIPWYKPLIPAQKIHRHLYWSNIELTHVDMPHENLRSIQIPELEKLHGIKISHLKYLDNKRQVLRNCVSPKVGLSILNDVINYKNSIA